MNFLIKSYIIIVATDHPIEIATGYFVEQVTRVTEQTTKRRWECLSSDEEYVHSSGYILELKVGCILARTRIDFMSKRKYDNLTLRKNRKVFLLT